MALCGAKVSARQAFYYVVDERLEGVASVLACRLISLWGRDVHIFVEGSKGKQVAHSRSRVSHPRIFYHERQLEPCLPKGLPESTKWPAIVYSRMFAPRFLREYDRVIYLDADILPIRRDDQIWTLSLPHGLGAVHDYAVTHDSPFAGKTRAEWLRSIGVSSGRYFNSGVLIIDVKPWLEIDFPVLLCRYVENHGDSMRMFDQDFLNNVFQNTWSELSPSWNFQAVIFDIDIDKIFLPIFIHFSKVDKPWMGRFDKNIHDIDKLSYDYLIFYSRMHNIDIDHLISKRSISNYSVMRYYLRKKISLFGIMLPKELKYRRNLDIIRENFLKYLKDVRSKNGFVDIEEWAASDEFRLPLYDGKFLRLPASEAIKSQLTVAIPNKS